ncbi:hypothetical protein B0H66DRAFT_535893 [Apodospora peruviana]|uniref:Uncharacterized protein n=1 Tax=Apodospora peruviana TaxID=516989 RepID=A0AAE0HXZ8_9PEZI|nr:hypothetical protein B0H66DRAFT_535893 [Apodospora peruviana]
MNDKAGSCQFDVECGSGPRPCEKHRAREPGGVVYGVRRPDGQRIKDWGNKTGEMQKDTDAESPSTITELVHLVESSSRLSSLRRLSCLMRLASPSPLIKESHARAGLGTSRSEERREHICDKSSHNYQRKVPFSAEPRTAIMPVSRRQQADGPLGSGADASELTAQGGKGVGGTARLTANEEALRLEPKMRCCASNAHGSEQPKNSGEAIVSDIVGVFSTETSRVKFWPLTPKHGRCGGFILPYRGSLVFRSIPSTTSGADENHCVDMAVYVETGCAVQCPKLDARVAVRQSILKYLNASASPVCGTGGPPLSLDDTLGSCFDFQR